METPAMLRGYLYPSVRVSRCPRFHRCIITHKCQNYDPHQVDCQFCETRCQPAQNLGGIIPEGELIPDLQDAVRCVQQTMMRPFAHPDAPVQKINGREIARTHDKFTKSQQVLSSFASTGLLDIEEKVKSAMYDLEKKKLLGRIE